MRRSPIEHLVHELEKAFGKGLRVIECVARYYEAQEQVIIVATGIKRREDGSRERRKRVATIVLKITATEYEKLRKQIKYSVAFPYPITLPELT
jgi:hypothetical protein